MLESSVGRGAGACRGPWDTRAPAYLIALFDFFPSCVAHLSGVCLEVVDDLIQTGLIFCCWCGQRVGYGDSEGQLKSSPIQLPR